MKIIPALFRNREDAEKAVKELMELGMTKDDITVFVTDIARKTHFPPHIAGAPVKSLDLEETSRSEARYVGPKGPETSTLAAIASGMAGGGIFLSQSVGLLAAGPAVAAGTVNREEEIRQGPHADAVSYFMELGISKSDAQFFDKELEKGALMLMVRTNIDEQKVRDILHRKYGYVART